MQITKDLLVVIAQIIPVLLLASFLDGDVLNYLRKYARKAQNYWLFMMGFILVGEVVTLISISQGQADGWKAWVIWSAVFISLMNLFSIAVWRVRGVSFLAMTGFNVKKRPKNTPRE